MKKTILALVITVAGLSGFHIMTAAPVNAAVLDDVVFHGKIGNLTSETVTLQTETGKVILPRKAFNEKKKNLRPGTTVSVTVSLAEVVALNEKAAKKKK